MKASHNAITLVGNLTADPNFKAVGTGVAEFGLAVDRSYTKSDGSRETDFHDVEAWGKLGETVANNLKKGRLVLVTGSLEYDIYPDATTGKNVKRPIIKADDIRFLDAPSQA